MKLFPVTGAVIVFFSCASFFIPTSTVSVSGKIVWTDATRPASFTGMTFFVRSTHPGASCTIDSAQQYLVNFTDLGDKCYRFFITDTFDTLLLDCRALHFADESAIADFTLPKTYKKKDNKAICPVCEKTDNVSEIVYGDGVPAQKGKVIPGGCIIGPISPSWRCERDGVNY